MAARESGPLALNAAFNFSSTNGAAEHRGKLHATAGG